MACRTCGGRRQEGPPDPNRGLTGYWSVRWPHGPLQKFDTEEAALAFVASKRPDLGLVVLPPPPEEPETGD